MTDFGDALQAKLRRNAELERELEEKERELERRIREQREQQERAEERAREDRDAHHAGLVEALKELIRGLERNVPDGFVARGGWTESGEEYVVKITSVQITPARSLFIELDRDDDEVLARWTSSVGRSVEMWRLTEFSTEMLQQLVLDLVDQEKWRTASRPPAFPGAE